jgi:hypothetical protein
MAADNLLRWDTPGLHWNDLRLRWNGTAPAAESKPMSSQNLVSTQLTAQAVTDITAAITTIRTNLPFLLNLNAAQRKSLRNITEASQGIAQATINFVAQHPDALPGTFNTAEFNKDAALLAPLQQVASLIASLNTDTNDTLRALHSDLYAETLDVYAYAKAANRNGAYDDYLNTVKTRFSAGPRKKTTPDKPTT